MERERNSWREREIVGEVEIVVEREKGGEREIVGEREILGRERERKEIERKVKRERVYKNKGMKGVHDCAHK